MYSVCISSTPGTCGLVWTWPYQSEDEGKVKNKFKYSIPLRFLLGLRLLTSCCLKL